MKRKKRKNIITTEDHIQAIRWCLKNKIKVSVLPTVEGLKVEVNDKGKKTVSPEIYENYDAQAKCWELYLYIYNKLN